MKATKGANDAAMLIYGRIAELAERARREPGAFGEIEDIIMRHAVAPLSSAIVRLLDDAVPGAGEHDDARSVVTVEYTPAEWARCTAATKAARDAIA